MSNKPMTLSFGRMNKFESCKALYASQYIDKTPEMPSFPLEAGKRQHAFLDLYLAHLEKNEVTQDRQVVEDFVRQAFVDDIEAVNTDTYKDVLIVARVFAKHYHHNFAETVGREEWLEWMLPADEYCPEPTKIIGRYDRLYVEDELMVVRDYKTGYDATLSTANEFQGELYCRMLHDQYPGRRFTYEVYFTRANVIMRRKKGAMSDFDYADIESRVRTIRARILAAHNELIHPKIDRWGEVENPFPPTPGWHCSYCPVAVKCAKRNSLVRAEAMIDDNESALVALGDTIILEAAAKNRRKQLIEYSKRAAPVSLVDGTTAGYGRKTSIVVRDVDAFVEAMGLEDATEYLSIDNRKAKKLQNDDRVAGLFVEESKSAFDIANRAVLALPAGIGGDESEDAA
jgi:hypothetical protein